MCTSITYSTKDHYFGRNLDLEISYHEVVTITPRNYPFKFRRVTDIPTHYALIGMATVVNDYPLYYEATNETGLSMAGLNFPGNAHFFDEMSEKTNISPFEFIPWILSQCQNVFEARALLKEINLVNIDFSEDLPLSPLHWMIADQKESIVVESTVDGLKVYDNPIGVLTNNPTFDYQLFNLNNYRHVSTHTPENTFFKDLELTVYSRGMGSIGLPGDLSSSSRFIKAAFTKLNSVSGDSEAESVGQFFHILKSVEQQKGLCDVGNGQFEYTIYSSCCNMDKEIYYYTTYTNSQITAIDMHKVELDDSKLFTYPLIEQEQINYLN
ncbi:choloylglycine hydrolase [Enterococcus durans]|uniref:choloylglycine hydrolase n=2 Tax=Enterococcus durans TaxID=53345 RepID=A0AB36S7Z5_9ENTE|nr:choloylglycine hydrolase [Enterococcus durans]EOT35473.1 choloylglycine hydrolase [Enterococcus durans ATCC 6056]EOU19182.1 choloylglycine hydrolase [Enterococcus durans ATCC 6056]PEH44767.1 linear amide C-N hydrolase [Enterococcus durans]QPQ26018.1 choloylglycine hydrolase family protein [Enterococcus durans]QXB37805.1 choloylglycine hydrolase [Enterococcus durans]